MPAGRKQLSREELDALPAWEREAQLPYESPWKAMLKAYAGQRKRRGSGKHPSPQPSPSRGEGDRSGAPGVSAEHRQPVLPSPPGGEGKGEGFG